MPSPHALSPEILVNGTTAGTQANASITDLADGGFVVTWHRSNEIYARTFHVDGTPASGEFLVDVAQSYSFARVVALSDGRFVVSWVDQYDVFAQVFNADGSLAGSQLQVAAGALLQYDVSIAALNAGRYVISWTQDESSGLDTNLYGRIYAADGSASANFRLNGVASGGNLDYQFTPTLTALSNGQFVAAWEDTTRGSSGSSTEIRGQIFNVDGTKSGGELLLSLDAVSSGRWLQQDPSITALKSGGFVVTYIDLYGTNDTYGQIFSSTGARVGPEFRVNQNTEGSAHQAQVAALDNGGFVVTWTQSTANNQDVMAQYFNASGARVGEEFVVHTTAVGNQSAPAVTVLPSGQIALSWSGQGTGDTNGVFVRLFSPDSFAPDAKPGVGGSFVEGGGPVFVAPQLTLADPDSATLTQATVQISSGLNAGQDRLTFTAGADTGNITGTYTAATGTLVLNSSGGSATLAQWQAALRAVGYDNDSQAPSTTSRTISFTLSDAQGPGLTTSTTVGVQAINDAPVLTASGGSASFVEGNNAAGVPVAVDPGLVLSDVDSTTFAQASVAITAGFRAGEDTLALSGSFGNIQSSYNAATGMLTLTSAGATATTAQWQGALRAVQYTNSSDTPHANTRSISFVIQDSAGATSLPVTRTVDVTPTNDTPLAALPLAHQSVDQDSPFLFTVPPGSFTDADGDALTYSATLADGSALPAWLSFDPLGRSFSGTPGNADVGTVSVRVTVNDGHANGVASSSFSLTIHNVNDAPTVALPLADQSATQDSAFNFTLPAGTFDDIDGGDTLSYTATRTDGSALPAWLDFDGATGLFSGTPGNADVGAFSVRVTATDGSGLSASDDFTITVANVNDTPTLAQPLPDQGATQDAAFSFTLPAGTFDDIDVGDTLSYTATRTDGSALPAWLGFDSATGLFSGTPGNADVGALSVRVTATDAGGLSAFDDFTITVANVNDAPTLALPVADQLATQGKPFHLPLPAGTFVDVDAGDTLAFTAALDDGRALPAWLRFDATTGVFSGTPGNADVGTLNIRLTATDRDGLWVNDHFTLTVANVNDAPTLLNLPDAPQKVTVGVAAALPALLVHDADGANVPLTLTLTASHATLTGAPDADPAQPGLQLSGTAAQIHAALAQLSVTAWAAGSSRLTFSLSDGIASAPTTGSLALDAAPPPGTSAIDWVVYAGSRADYALTPGRDGVWTVRPVAGGPATPLPGIERLQFDDGAVALDLQGDAAAGQAARLVFSLWGQAGLRNTDLLGEAVAYVDALGAAAFGQTAESLGLLAALAGGSEPGAFLTLLHTNLVGRAPDAAELQALLDFQAAGNHSLAELLAIATGLPQVSQALGALQSSGLALTPFGGVLHGSGDGEVFRARQGDDRIDAGPGLDTVLYDDVASRYTLSREEADTSAVRWVVQGPAQDGGRDVLHGVERLQFADHAVALDLDGAAGQALRLLAVAQGREALADRALLGEVIAAVDARGAQGLVKDLQAQGVLDALAGGDSLEALVTLLYRHVAGHTPSEADMQWALAWAGSQQWDRADLLLQVAQLPQTAELVGLDTLAIQGVAYDMWMG